MEFDERERLLSRVVIVEGEEFEPVEKSLGNLHAHRLVLPRLDPALLHHRRIGLAKSWQKRGEHHRNLFRPRQIVNQLPRFVQNHSGVNEDDPFGMGDRVLRAIDQGVNFGPEFFGDPEVRAAHKPIEGRRDCSSHFSTSAQYSFGGQIGKVYRSAKLDRRRINRVFEARGELHRAQDPQAVLDESFWIDDADDAARYVFAPAVKIEDFVLERVVHHRVDGEIAAARGLVKTHPRVAFDHEAAMPTPRLGFTTRQADVYNEAPPPLPVAQPDFVNSERLADRIHFAALFDQRTQEPELRVRKLLCRNQRFDPARKIAHPPADEQRPPACFPNRFAEFDNGARDHNDFAKALPDKAILSAFCDRIASTLTIRPDDQI